jgi:hypothetical protein
LGGTVGGCEKQAGEASLGVDVEGVGKVPGYLVEILMLEGEEQDGDANGQNALDAFNHCDGAQAVLVLAMFHGTIPRSTRRSGVGLGTLAHPWKIRCAPINRKLGGRPVRQENLEAPGTETSGVSDSSEERSAGIGDG